MTQARPCKIAFLASTPKFAIETSLITLRPQQGIQNVYKPPPANEPLCRIHAAS